MLKAEFTIEPFVTGDRGAYGDAALAVVRGSGLVFDDGPFGTSVVGSDTAVIATVGEVLAAAMDSGATRVSLQLTRADDADE